MDFGPFSEFSQNGFRDFAKRSSEVRIFYQSNVLASGIRDVVRFKQELEKIATGNFFLMELSFSK